MVLTKMKVSVLLLFPLLALTVAEEVGESVKEVHLKQGTIQGIRQEAKNSRSFYSFRGIPYAEPPVGDLRLKDPVPAGPWTGTRTEFTPPSCPQTDVQSMFNGDGSIIVIGEEDCLYLHVYTPQVSSPNLPVMVWIHGGAFVLGDADMYGGTPDMLLTEDVVLVSIQYRLGTLGFLSSEDEVIPGNFGLKDQTLALQWVQENIRHFGGDPAKVTVFGESAGAGSTHYQVLTPKAKGLFSRAILQSGTALCNWALRNDHQVMAGKIGQWLNCTEFDPESPDSATLLKCLQETAVDKLVTASMIFNVWGSLPMFMAPRVDGDYLPAHPAELVKEGRYNKVDLIIGINKNEGGGVATMMLKDGSFDMTKLISNVASAILMVDTEENSEYLTSRMFYKYIKDLNMTVDDAEALMELMSDASMNICDDLTSQFHARDHVYGRRVYRYQLDHSGKTKVMELFLKITAPFGDNWVHHGEDVQYLFSSTTFLKDHQLERHNDIYLSNIMIKLWTNFAATGDPTPDMSLGFKWEATRETPLRHLSLTTSLKMKEDSRAEIREFWNDLPMQVNKMLFPEKFGSHSSDVQSTDHCDAENRWHCKGQ